MFSNPFTSKLCLVLHITCFSRTQCIWSLLLALSHHPCLDWNGRSGAVHGSFGDDRSRPLHCGSRQPHVDCAGASLGFGPFVVGTNAGVLGLKSPTFMFAVCISLSFFLRVFGGIECCLLFHFAPTRGSSAIPARFVF